MPITRHDIVEGLRKLGVEAGDTLMVHSALSSLGRVEGGADTVIDALIEAVGPSGMIVMPTLYIPAITGAEVFDVAKSPSQMGLVTETFRKRPGVVRSVHPTHPVAAFGARAEELIRDHAKAPTACGKGTPFSKLIDWGGKILLIGVDQDRNTLLHTAEDHVDAPYLTIRKARYRDPGDGRVKEITLARFPGPHRNFIGLDRLFRESGVMRIGKIGGAVCRLMDVAGAVRVVVEALRADPAAVLCDNAECADCVRQRGAIRRAELAKEDFTLAVRIDEPVDAAKLSVQLQAFGISAIEIGPNWLRHIPNGKVEAAVKAIGDSDLRVTAIDIEGARSLAAAFSLAQSLGCPTVVTPGPSRECSDATAQIEILAKDASEHGLSLLVRNAHGTCVDTAASTTSLKEAGVGLAFDPSGFGAAGEMPFLKVYYHGLSKSLVRQLYVKDGTFDGRPTEPGKGNGEVKELISILRCRSFSGPMVIWPHESVRASCEAFWELLHAM